MAILKTFRKDHTTLGLILGALGPMLGFLIFYLLKFLPHGESLGDYLHLFSSHHFLIPKVMSLSLLMNAITFFFYTQYHKDLTAKGILIVTLIYAVIILIFKL